MTFRLGVFAEGERLPAERELAELRQDRAVLAPNITPSHAQHAEIVEAVLNGDHQRARVVMEEHSEATSALVRALLSQPKGTSR